MEYSFELTPRRIVSEANYNTLVTPVLHPHRVMFEHDFLYIIEGTWNVQVTTPDGQKGTFPLKQDNLLILPSGWEHEGIANCSSGLRNMYFHALPLDHDGLKQTDNTATLPLMIHCETMPEISMFFHEVIAEQWQRTAHSDIRLSSLVTLLLCTLEKRTSQTNEGVAAFLASVSREVHRNPHKSLSAQEAADIFGISVRSLNSRFQKACGKTFLAWQRDQKLEMTRQYLVGNPGVTLREAAANFGFYDEFHLSRAFKKYFGISPKQAR